MRRTMTFLLLVLLFSVGTWFGGWWALPLLAAVAGAWRRAREVGLAALLSWGALLLVDAGGERFGALSGSLAGAFGAPSLVVVLVTLLFAWLLAWSAAGVVEGSGLRARAQGLDSGPGTR